ncbi:hypothetical protein PR048_033323 [Dryococelus australis]|uniref:Uncharacterized protein n=1 Tax=Dryococelus australis TaxID=614101 RepID=A0ABQ9G454_9NEOP|nr:hypothetical protein PR048_033323 [Dryococelus australis]
MSSGKFQYTFSNRSFGETSENPRWWVGIRLNTHAVPAERQEEPNEGAGETGDPRENPPTSGIVRHDSRMLKYGSVRQNKGSAEGSLDRTGVWRKRNNWTDNNFDEQLFGRADFRQNRSIIVRTSWYVGATWSSVTRPMRYPIHHDDNVPASVLDDCIFRPPPPPNHINVERMLKRCSHRKSEILTDSVSVWGCATSNRSVSNGLPAGEYGHRALVGERRAAAQLYSRALCGHELESAGDPAGGQEDVKARADNSAPKRLEISADSMLQGPANALSIDVFFGQPPKVVHHSFLTGRPVPLRLIENADLVQIILILGARLKRRIVLEEDIEELFLESEKFGRREKLKKRGLYNACSATLASTTRRQDPTEFHIMFYSLLTIPRHSAPLNTDRKFNYTEARLFTDDVTVQLFETDSHKEVINLPIWHVDEFSALLSFVVTGCPLRSPARSGDGALVTRSSVALTALQLLGLKRGTTLQADQQSYWHCLDMWRKSTPGHTHLQCVLPTSRGAVGWCTTDLGCGSLWARIPGKTLLSSIKLGDVKKSFTITIHCLLVPMARRQKTSLAVLRWLISGPLFYIFGFFSATVFRKALLQSRSGPGPLFAGVIRQAVQLRPDNVITVNFTASLLKEAPWDKCVTERGNEEIQSIVSTKIHRVGVGSDLKVTRRTLPAPYCICCCHTGLYFLIPSLRYAHQTRKELRRITEIRQASWPGRSTTHAGCASKLRASGWGGAVATRANTLASWMEHGDGTSPRAPIPPFRPLYAVADVAHAKTRERPRRLVPSDNLCVSETTNKEASEEIWAAFNSQISRQVVFQNTARSFTYLDYLNYFLTCVNCLHTNHVRDMPLLPDSEWLLKQTEKTNGNRQTAVGVIEVSMEQCRNEGARETGDSRENPADQRHRQARFPHLRKSGSEQANRSATVAPLQTSVSFHVANYIHDETYHLSRAAWDYFPSVVTNLTGRTPASELLKALAYLPLYSAFEAERRGSDKGDTTAHIKLAIASNRKALNWRAVFSSHCVHPWYFQRRPSNSSRSGVAYNKNENYSVGAHQDVRVANLRATSPDFISRERERARERERGTMVVTAHSTQQQIALWQLKGPYTTVSSVFKEQKRVTDTGDTNTLAPSVSSPLSARRVAFSAVRCTRKFRFRPAHVQLLTAIEPEKRESDKGDSATRIKDAVASKPEALKLRREFLNTLNVKHFSFSLRLPLDQSLFDTPPGNSAPINERAQQPVCPQSRVVHSERENSNCVGLYIFTYHGPVGPGNTGHAYWALQRLLLVGRRPMKSRVDCVYQTMCRDGVNMIHNPSNSDRFAHILRIAACVTSRRRRENSALLLSRENLLPRPYLILALHTVATYHNTNNTALRASLPWFISPSVTGPYVSDAVWVGTEVAPQWRVLNSDWRFGAPEPADRHVVTSPSTILEASNHWPFTSDL